MNKFEKEAMDTAIYWNEEGFNKRNIKITYKTLFIFFPHYNCDSKALKVEYPSIGIKNSDLENPEFIISHK